MPGKILGIDISEHSISAVQVISGLKGYQVVACFSTPITDNNLSKAIEDLSGGFDLKSDKCLLTIPSSNTSFRSINTPFTDSKKVRQTLPFEIETLVPFAVDEMILDYIHTDKDNPASVLTAAMNKEHIRGYIEQLKNAGVDPDKIDIRPAPAATWLLEQERTPENGIYLDLELEHPCVVIFQNKKIALIRELPCSYTGKSEETDSDGNERSHSEPIENIINTICREADRTVYSFNSKIKNSFIIEKVFFGGRLSAHSSTSALLNNFFTTPAERISISKDSRFTMDAGLSGIYKPALMDNALAAAIRENKKSIGFNFRRGEFAVKRSIFGPGKDIKRVAVLTCIFLSLMILNTCVDYYYINKKHTTVEDYFNKEFDKRIPDQRGVKGTKLRISIARAKIKAVENPSEQASDSVRSDQKVVDNIKEIADRVYNKYDFYINTFTAKNNEITISATTDNYSTVEKIANVLKGSDMFKNVDISSPAAPDKDNRIKFELKLTRAK